jgi:hypothetical protein
LLAFVINLRSPCYSLGERMPEEGRAELYDVFLFASIFSLFLNGVTKDA